MRHRRPRFQKDTVAKIAPPDVMRVEIEKTRRAFDIARDCGLFRVPRVLDYDQATGTATFERIAGIRPFFSVGHKSRPTIDRIGRSLAVIHRHLSLPDEMVVPLPTEFALAGTEVFLHGDFNGANVCINARSDEIVILDWQMTSRHGGRATFGSRFFDLIWFVNFMLWKPTLSYLIRDPVAPVATAFIQSYFEEARLSYDAETLVRYARNFFQAKLPFRKQNASWTTRYLLPRSQILTQRFVKSLETIRFLGDTRRLR